MKLFSCLTCLKNGEGETSFTIKSKCFDKPLVLHLSNDDEKFQMLHELIWALIGDDETAKEKVKRTMSKKTQPLPEPTSVPTTVISV
jgi:hypothetical protein